ncbi:hypothetical protein MVEN_01581900 [Mycena venus]|uniref:Uncharacterized protein n=1 Tax=Mycena venus TaxID=2733690 RepID=A0A8H7CRJ7_9AGAR|nr:hypothetical protein MVEN_01581900 [Mycena venus]
MSPRFPAPALFNTSHSSFIPSIEAPAVAWVLETSTDPFMLLRATHLVIDLQWPITMNVEPQRKRLWESFLACFHHFEYSHQPADPLTLVLRDLRNGMEDRAIEFGRAYHSLSCVNQQPSLSETRFEMWFSRDTHHPNLQNILHILGFLGVPLILESSIDLEWLLHVLPLRRRNLDRRGNIDYLTHFLAELDRTLADLELERPAFSDYLFCVYAFLSDGEMAYSDMVCMDKTAFQQEIFQLLLTAIISKLESKQISMDFAANIVRTTCRLSGSTRVWNVGERGRRDAMYQFCSKVPRSDGWVQLVLAAGPVAVHWSWLPEKSTEDGAGPAWVYEALNSAIIPSHNPDEWDIETQTGVASLLLALHHYDAPPLEEHIHLILRALSTGGYISEHAALLLLQSNVVNWFQDAQLRPMLQQAGVWAFLTHWLLEINDSELNDECILLGRTLSTMPDWQAHLRQEQSSWIAIFFGSTWDLVDEYNTVVTSIWKPSIGGYAFTSRNEEALGLTYAALSQVWQEFDFSTSRNLKNSLPWLRCSGQVVLFKEFTNYLTGKVLRRVVVTQTADFTKTFALPLRDALVQAGHQFTSASSNGKEDGEAGLRKQIRKLLEGLASNIPEPTDAEKRMDYWDGLQSQFDVEIGELEESLRKLAMSGERTSEV